MSRRVFVLLGFSLFSLLIFQGCSPPNFVKTSLANWKSIEFRPNLERDEAWHRISDTLAKNYDLEVIDKDSGYIRTAWMFTTSGKVDENYRARVITNIPVSNDKVEVKIDAHWFDPWKENWIMGYDTMLLEQVYTDLQGTVGRVAR